MIELAHVTKRFGDVAAVDDISLHIAKGKFCALVGTSGCGKSTTLRMINRLIEHSDGDIILDGQPVAAYDPVKLAWYRACLNGPRRIFRPKSRS